MIRHAATLIPNKLNLWSNVSHYQTDWDTSARTNTQVSWSSSVGSKRALSSARATCGVFTWFSFPLCGAVCSVYYSSKNLSLLLLARIKIRGWCYCDVPSFEIIQSVTAAETSHYRQCIHPRIILSRIPLLLLVLAPKGVFTMPSLEYYSQPGFRLDQHYHVELLNSLLCVVVVRHLVLHIVVRMTNCELQFYLVVQLPSYAGQQHFWGILFCEYCLDEKFGLAVTAQWLSSTYLPMSLPRLDYHRFYLALAADWGRSSHYSDGLWSCITVQLVRLNH